MIRVRGQIGQWPVDLTIEMDSGDWQALAENITVQVPSKVPQPDLTQALALLEIPIEGPELLAKLEALVGSSAAAKRLLVRLRHSEDVLISTQGAVQVWQRKEL